MGWLELAAGTIKIRACDHPMLEFFEMLVVCQLLAMEIAIRLGADVDMCRAASIPLPSPTTTACWTSSSFPAVPSQSANWSPPQTPGSRRPRQARADVRPLSPRLEITAREMCGEMVAEDLKTAQRHALLKAHGLDLPMPSENG